MNRKAATAGKFGIDSTGIQWEEGKPLHAWVDYQKGKSALSAGALDSYAVKMVRMNFTDKLNERSRVKFKGHVYQIVPETFNSNFRKNTVQFLMQLVVNDNPAPTPTPTPSTSNITGGSRNPREIGG